MKLEESFIFSMSNQGTELRRSLDGEVVIAYGRSPEPPSCPLCRRPVYQGSKHHVVPHCRGGKRRLKVCVDCHRAIHATFSNKELEEQYNTAEALMTHEGFARMVAFIAKQDGRVRMKLGHNQRKRGRNG